MTVRPYYKFTAPLSLLDYVCHVLLGANKPSLKVAKPMFLCCVRESGSRPTFYTDLVSAAMRL